MLKAAAPSAAPLCLVHTISAMTCLLLGAVLLGSLGVTVQGNLIYFCLMSDGLALPSSTKVSLVLLFMF